MMRINNSLRAERATFGFRLRAASKVREKLLCEEERNGTHKKTRCRGRNRAEYCSNRALDEPPRQRSDEDCDEGGHHPADR